MSTQTLSRWIKNIWENSGIDISYFSAYSTRHALTSAASRGGINIESILKAAGWMQKSNTFARFYMGNIMGDKTSFALSILNNNHKQMFSFIKYCPLVFYF